MKHYSSENLQNNDQDMIEGIKIEGARQNLYFCPFKSHKEDNRQIVKEWPWFFDKALKLFLEPKGNISIVDLDFRYVACRILKIDGYGDWKFEAMDSDEDDQCWGEIAIDVTKALEGEHTN